MSFPHGTFIPHPSSFTGIGERTCLPQTQFSEFPWMTAILHEELDPQGNVQSLHQCSGSLIHLQAIHKYL